MRCMAMNNIQDDQQADQTQDMSVQQEYAEVTNLRPTVGDELRMRREEAGHSIADLAEALRIQKRYLEALEAGRIDDLPGTVYALGFLRTYAEYYGFDGDAFVTRFKEETEGRRQSQEYVLPEPLEEARVPTAAIALIGIALAIGAVVIWYSMRPPEAEVAGAVPEVPAHLALPVEEAKPVEAPVVTEPAAASAPSAPAPEAEPAAATGSSEPETPPAEPAVATAPAPAPAPAPEPEPASAPEAQAEPETAITAAPPPQPAAEAASTSDEENIAAVSTETVPVAPAEPASEQADPHTPQVYGGTANARIVITAVDDSWLEITDAEGNRLMSRTLRVGDSYRVPNRDGLVFVTGNAGGLSISVDGEPTPALGGIGIVRKNVKLDPELLKEGRAWP